MNVLWVMLGGAAGSALRYATYQFAEKFLPITFPYGTLMVNLLGAFIAGFAGALLMSGLSLAQPLRLLIIVGFCGGLTTFSTFSIDNAYLLQGGGYLTLGLNICMNVVLCVVLVLFGMFVGNKV